MHRTRRWLTLSAFLGLLFGSVPTLLADDPKAEALTVDQLMSRMAYAYANCKTYRDTGNVQTIFSGKGGDRTVNKPFTTAFIRPDRFRFEYKEQRPDGRETRYLVWSKDQEVQSWWDIKPGIQKPDSLGLALASATGVSSASAHTIPVLLMPNDISGRSLTAMTELKRQEDAKLDDFYCFVIEGKYADHPQTVWLDKKTYLVRRIDSQRAFPDFRTEVTTTYDPHFDTEISDSLLVFDPPQ